MMMMNRSRIWLGAAAISFGTLALIAGAGPAAAQNFDLRSLFSSPGKPAAQAPPDAAPSQVPSQAPREWTGEDGASGHPLMRASAIRAAAANFRTCLEAIWPLAQRRNVPRQLFDQLLAGVTPDLRIGCPLQREQILSFEHAPCRGRTRSSVTGSDRQQRQQRRCY